MRWLITSQSGRIFASAVVAVVCLALTLALTGCQPATFISALEAVVSAAEIAVPVIGAATGLSPQTSAAIVTYLQDVNLAAAQASSILGGTGTGAQKAAKVIQIFAKVAAGCNCIPPGTPLEVVAVVNAVSQAVVDFLAHFPTAGPPPVVKATATDRAALANIRTRAEKNVAHLKGVKP